MKYPHLCCSFFRPFFSLMCAFSNVSLLRRVFVFSRRISWESSTFCRCKHLSIRSPFVACLFSFAVFFRKGSAFCRRGKPPRDRNAHHYMIRNLCPRKSHASSVAWVLFLFLRFASSLRRICSTRILNVEMNIKMQPGSLGALDPSFNIHIKSRPKLTKANKSMICGKKIQ